jgi:hypothetical protein
MKIALALLALLSGIPALGADLALQRSGAVSWVCGGVGSDERRAIESMRREASIEVLFVEGKRGAYVSDAKLRLRAEGGEPLLDVTADGPVCLIDAPAGRYELAATYGGATRTARASVARDGAPRRVVFAFPEEPWDGIRASPEEKAQAAQP